MSWMALIPAAALVPFLVMARPMWWLWRKGRVPQPAGAGMLILFLLTVGHVSLVVFADPPRWEGFLWTGLAWTVSGTLIVHALWKYRHTLAMRRYFLFGPRRTPPLTADEKALLLRAERQAVRGMRLDVPAGLDDLRDRAARHDQQPPS